MQLCGRRLYETMLYWETAQESPLAADEVVFAQIWKAPRNSPARTSPSAAPASPARVWNWA
jgi:hypothetical protein